MINLVYWMLGFDAGTAEKIALKIKKRGRDFREKRRAKGKGAESFRDRHGSVADLPPSLTSVLEVQCTTSWV